MKLLNPKFIVDSKGKKLAAILPMKEFKLVLEELEGFDDVKLYDSVKRKNESSIPFGQYLKKRKQKG